MNAAERMTEEYADSKDFLTVYISDQLFGIPVLQVEDVLGEQTVTKIPLCPPKSRDRSIYAAALLRPLMYVNAWASNAVKQMTKTR